MAGAIQKATESKVSKDNAAKMSINVMMASLLDREGMRKRFDELLGKRSPQFISSIVSLVNSDVNLQKAFNEAPMTIIQAALKAATYDLPIDPNLGYAYIMPFNNSIKNADGSFTKRMEATFILGYKGMHQMALRTGVYKVINVLDVREGELKKYNRLTEEIEFDFIEDDEEREKTPIIGYAGYYKLINGTEKTIFMTKKQIEAHERKYRKGQYMGKGWRDDFDAMALKTVYRKLIGKWGLMSIDYRTADKETVALATAIAEDGNDSIIDIDTIDGTVVEKVNE
jgi:recombination protein RecT